MGKGKRFSIQCPSIKNDCSFHLRTDDYELTKSKSTSNIVHPFEESELKAPCAQQRALVHQHHTHTHAYQSDLFRLNHVRWIIDYKSKIALHRVFVHSNVLPITSFELFENGTRANHFILFSRKTHGR